MRMQALLCAIPMTVAAAPATMKSNQAFALPEGKPPPRPTPAVPSIYEWQNRKN